MRTGTTPPPGISAATFSRGVPVAYVATGQRFPDALSGAPAGGVDGGPVLLVRSGSIPAPIAAELTRLKPQRIVVLGGTASVSSSVLADLRAYTTGSVSRLSGADRYDASATISATTFDPGAPVAYIATGERFPDALSGGPAGGVEGGPVLLVRSTSIPSSIAAELSRLQPQRIVVLGGTESVSGSVAEQLSSTTAETPGPTSTMKGCASRPSSCGYPDASNTGVSAGVTLRDSGCVHATKDGQVISGVHVRNCKISVEAKNVVIRDVKVTETDLDMWAIIVREGASATISNVEVAGNGQGTQSVQYAILSQTDSRVTIDRANLYNCADCVQGENIVMTNSYIHASRQPAGRARRRLPVQRLLRRYPAPQHHLQLLVTRPRRSPSSPTSVPRATP